MSNKSMDIKEARRILEEQQKELEERAKACSEEIEQVLIKHKCQLMVVVGKIEPVGNGLFRPLADIQTVALPEE
jgi:hypothetical protein